MVNRALMCPQCFSGSVEEISTTTNDYDIEVKLRCKHCGANFSNFFKVEYKGYYYNYEFYSAEGERL